MGLLRDDLPQLLLFCNQHIILKLAGEQSVFNRFNRVLQSGRQTFVSDDLESMDFYVVSYYSIHRLIEFN